MLKHTLIAAVAAGILASASYAVADTVSGHLSSDTNVNDAGAGVNPGTQDMTVNFGAGNIGSAWVGKINWTSVNTGANPTTDPGLGSFVLPTGTAFSTYCIEGNQDVYFGGTYTWTISALQSGVLAPDHGVGSTYFTDAQVNDIASFWNRYYDLSLTSGEYATAFQLGIWEIAGDDNLSATGTAANYFTTGNFQAFAKNPSDVLSTDVLALNDAANWLDAVFNGTAYATNGEYSIYTLTNSSAQDQLVGLKNPDFGTPAVPVPAALPAGLSLIGLIAAAGFFRRRRQMA